MIYLSIALVVVALLAWDAWRRTLVARGADDAAHKKIKALENDKADTREVLEIIEAVRRRVMALEDARNGADAKPTLMRPLPGKAR